MKALIQKLLEKLGFRLIRVRHLNGELKEHLINVISHFEIDCILDVGANVGQYGRMLRDIGFEGHIISFEPVRSVYDKLLEEASRDPKWLCYNWALGLESERKQISVFDSTVFSSFHVPTEYSKTNWSALRNAKSEDVQVERLDDHLDALKGKTGCSRFMLKLDTQGHDIFAFRGAHQSVASVLVLQSEISLIKVYESQGDAFDILREFERSGFNISGMYPVNRDSSLAVIEYDCVMVRR